MGWKSPSNHQLREYVCNFLQASNKQVQVMLYPEVCRMVPASPCWWINVSMLLEYLLRMVPWKYLMQLGKDQIWLLGQVEGGPSHHLEVGWNNYTFVYIYRGYLSPQAIKKGVINPSIYRAKQQTPPRRQMHLTFEARIFVYDTDSDNFLDYEVRLCCWVVLLGGGWEFCWLVVNCFLFKCECLFMLFFGCLRLFFSFSCCCWLFVLLVVCCHNPPLRFANLLPQKLYNS